MEDSSHALSADIYEKLKTVRRSRGLSVQKLAEKMGENHQRVGRIERGQTNLTIDYLVKLSKALDTPIDELITHKEIQKEEEVQEDPSLLSAIVLWIEKHAPQLHLHNNPEKKAHCVSLIYSQTLKISKEYRQYFLNTLFVTFELWTGQK